MKFYEFEPHLVILEHFVSFAPLFASDNFMKKLNDEQREQIIRAANDAGTEFAKQVATETEEIRDWLATEGGMAMTTPDKTDFVEAAKGVQAQFSEQRVQNLLNLLAEYKLPLIKLNFKRATSRGPLYLFETSRTSQWWLLSGLNGISKSLYAARAL